MCVCPIYFTAAYYNAFIHNQQGHPHLYYALLSFVTVIGKFCRLSNAISCGGEGNLAIWVVNKICFLHARSQDVDVTAQHKYIYTCHMSPTACIQTAGNWTILNLSHTEDNKKWKCNAAVCNGSNVQLWLFICKLTKLAS